MFKNLSFLIRLAALVVSFCILAKLNGNNKTIFLRSFWPLFFVSSTTSGFAETVSDFTFSKTEIPPLPALAIGFSAAFSTGTACAIIGVGAKYPDGTFKTIPSFTPSESDGFNSVNSS
ncbi:hypothetical protein D3C86_1519370 [compost metagenome]